jgi:hypothetical protein
MACAATAAASAAAADCFTNSRLGIMSIIKESTLASAAAASASEPHSLSQSSDAATIVMTLRLHDLRPSHAETREAHSQATTPA